jgi:hypothetical protein
MKPKRLSVRQFLDDGDKIRLSSIYKYRTEQQKKALCSDQVGFDECMRNLYNVDQLLRQYDLYNNIQSYQVIADCPHTAIKDQREQYIQDWIGQNSDLDPADYEVSFAITTLQKHKVEGVDKEEEIRIPLIFYWVGLAEDRYNAYNSALACAKSKYNLLSWQNPVCALIKKIE